MSSREGGQQVWVADFDGATGATSNAKKLTAIATEADNAKWSPDSKSIVFTSAVYADCQSISTADFDTGNKCNADRDAALAASKVKAQIWTQLMYRHWDHFTGNKRTHLFLVSVDGSGMRDLNPGDPRDVPPDYASIEQGCGCDFSPDGKGLAFTENFDPVPAVSTHADIFTLDLTDPTAKPVKVSTSAGGNFNPAYSPDGKYLAWRSQARNGYESDLFRLAVYDLAAKTVTDVLPKFDNWVDEFAWGRDSKSIYFASRDLRGGSGLYIKCDRWKADRFPPLLPMKAGIAICIRSAANVDTLIAAKMTVQSPQSRSALQSHWVGHTLFDIVVSDNNGRRYSLDNPQRLEE